MWWDEIMDAKIPQITLHCRDMNCHFRTAGQMAQANDARRVYFFMIIRKNTPYVRVEGGSASSSMLRAWRAASSNGMRRTQGHAPT